MHPSIKSTGLSPAHAKCLVRSYAHFTGRKLIQDQASDAELVQALDEAPFVVVSHGTEADPVLNYGNATALALWEMSWAEFTRTPSRLTAEAPNREERARLLAAVSAHGFIDNYSGVRISKTGRRFLITQATVWNLLTDDGQPCGQAASFNSWTWL
ncbi:MAG: MEKHLA domain-containing protein [Opitutus sp.]|nr:MEKHLA domain-containing protein [Opitutus sp.]MCS6248534.1 MEKHLA domain-containing protein [Opitutus sp.]MCS6275294.1 MEKHLA domain-containing protein [Opitutus sp.]MCS6277715.1 MEKHLA domain-containing protein [Opitutus sp.]MCS6299180.1 MEKHLA domain-containing protein [Opitutus sp.]